MAFAMQQVLSTQAILLELDDKGTLEILPYDRKNQIPLIRFMRMWADSSRCSNLAHLATCPILSLFPFQCS
jgi:hypothetical protein